MKQGTRVTEEFKLKVVKDYLSNNYNQTITGHRHNLTQESVSRYTKYVRTTYPFRYKFYRLLGVLNA